MKFYVLNSGIFKCNIIFCVGSPTAFRRWLRKRIPAVTAEQRKLVNKSEGLTWKLLTQETGFFYLVWVRNPKDFAPISHELIHLSMFLLAEASIPVTHTEHEVLCYLQENFMDQVQDIVAGRQRELRMKYPEVAELADAAASKAAAPVAWGFDSPLRDHFTVKL